MAARRRSMAATARTFSIAHDVAWSAAQFDRLYKLLVPRPSSSTAGSAAHAAPARFIAFDAQPPCLKAIASGGSTLLRDRVRGTVNGIEENAAHVAVARARRSPPSILHSTVGNSARPPTAGGTARIGWSDARPPTTKPSSMLWPIARPPARSQPRGRRSSRQRRPRRSVRRSTAEPVESRRRTGRRPRTRAGRSRERARGRTSSVQSAQSRVARRPPDETATPARRRNADTPPRCDRSRVDPPNAIVHVTMAVE